MEPKYDIFVRQIFLWFSVIGDQVSVKWVKYKPLTMCKNFAKNAWNIVGYATVFDKLDLLKVGQGHHRWC